MRSPDHHRDEDGAGGDGEGGGVDQRAPAHPVVGAAVDRQAGQLGACPGGGAAGHLGGDRGGRQRGQDLGAGSLQLGQAGPLVRVALEDLADLVGAIGWDLAHGDALE